MIPFGRSHAREPVAGPLEGGRLRDGNEPEIPLGEPLLEEEQRFGVRNRRLLAQNLGETRTKLGLERGHAPILGERRPGPGTPLAGVCCR